MYILFKIFILSSGIVKLLLKSKSLPYFVANKSFSGFSFSVIFFPNHLKMFSCTTDKNETLPGLEILILPMLSYPGEKKSFFPIHHW